MKSRFCLTVLAIVIVLVSCSQGRKMAGRFVKQNRNTVVALYLPGSLVKQNLREDNMPSELEDATLEEQIEYMEGLIKVVNKIDDDQFLDVLYKNMKETLEDYGLTVKYWEDEYAEADSAHWIINVPRIEVCEANETQDFCDWVYSQRFCTEMPVDWVNVAAWFEFYNSPTSSMAFTEQNYFDNIDVSFEIDYDANRVYAKTYCDTISIGGFYGFASYLGKLYAGYCYDFLMNKYIDNHQVEPIDTINRFRYDPYERYFYRTDRDYLIEIK